ncbi:phosphotransferase [Candidatus Dojkabacteria bacterium]|uniref:Phosphotransferase n=1 Tax=Candidatus Dojkabacteria bacterium TaxID=2099670 RepID=A0A955L6T2_9BACT|nr:phosphotransferase [Candidatus Dojkabacteria bacterium]
MSESNNKKGIELAYKQDLMDSHTRLLDTQYQGADFSPLNGGRVSSVQIVDCHDGAPFVSKMTPFLSNPEYEHLFLATGSRFTNVPQLYSYSRVADWRTGHAPDPMQRLTLANERAAGLIEMEYIPGFTHASMQEAGMQLDATVAYARTLRELHSVTLTPEFQQEHLDYYPLQGIVAFYEWMKAGVPLEQIFPDYAAYDRIINEHLDQVDADNPTQLVTFDCNPNNASYLQAADTSITAFIFDPGFCATYGGDPNIDLGFFYRRAIRAQGVLEAFEEGYDTHIDWLAPRVQLGVVLRSLLTFKVLHDMDPKSFGKRITRETETIDTAMQYL